MEKLLNILTTWVLTIMLVITASPLAKAQEQEQTANILNNGSFSNETEGWELSGNVTYDGNNYGQLNKSVRFNGIDGGLISQKIILSTKDENKIINSIDGTFKSIGCNNKGSDWCTKTGTLDNLDTIDWLVRFEDGSQSEVLIFNFTSDYNHGTITQSFARELTKEFNTSNTNVEVIVSGFDTGGWAGQYGAIIDDLNIGLSLSEPVIIEEQPTIIEEQLTVIDDIHTGIIEIPVVNTDMGLIDNTLPKIDMVEIDVGLPVESDVEVVEDIPEEIKPIDMEEDLGLEPESEKEEEIQEIEIKIDNEVKQENTQKNEKVVKKQAPESQNKGDKKVSATLDTPKIESDIVVQELDLPTIVSFNKQYFENKYKDVINLTTTEIDFYDGQDGFNNQDYTQANTDFFNISSSSNGEWGMANQRHVVKVEQFRR